MFSERILSYKQEGYEASRICGKSIIPNVNWYLYDFIETDSLITALRFDVILLYWGSVIANIECQPMDSNN